MTVARLGYAAALTFTVACLLVVLLLVVIRLLQDRSERRRSRLRAPVWRHVLTLTTGCWRPWGSSTSSTPASTW